MFLFFLSPQSKLPSQNVSVFLWQLHSPPFIDFLIIFCMNMEEVKKIQIFSFHNCLIAQKLELMLC